jgi:EmrB/QacA subfamily drug resistance transporter
MGTMTTTTPAPDMTRPVPRWTVILASLTSFLVGLDALVVTTALPTLHERYGGGIEALGWTVNAYQLAFAASILTGSALGDRFGRRRVFVVGLVVFTAASVWCALSPSLGLLVAARSVQGIGGGLAVPLALALIIDVVPVRSRGRALGVWGAITGVAVATGPLVGGAVVEGLAWQWIFWLNVPVGTAVAVAALWKIPGGGASRGGGVDVVGLAVATVGVFCLAQAIIRGNDAGWSSPTVVGGFVAGGVALALFVGWERRARQPMMPLVLFGDRGFAAACVASFGLMAGVFGLGFLTAQYLQLALHHSPLEVGVRLLPATGVALLLSPLAGRLSDRIGDKPLVLLGLALLGAGPLLIGLFVEQTSRYGTILGPLLIAGTGIAIAFPTAATAALRAVHVSDTAIASGITNTFRQIGAVFGVALAVAVFAADGGYRTTEAFLLGYRPALLALAGTCAAAMVAAALIWRRQPLGRSGR